MSEDMKFSKIYLLQSLDSGFPIHWPKNGFSSISW